MTFLNFLQLLKNIFLSRIEGTYFFPKTKLIFFLENIFYLLTFLIINIHIKVLKNNLKKPLSMKVTLTVKSSLLNNCLYYKKISYDVG
jgi:hypothetical protein